MGGNWRQVAGWAALATVVALPARAQSGAPAITSPNVADYGWVWSNADVDPAFHYLITATNTPTRFGASGLPLFVSVDPQRGYVSGPATQPGLYTITVSATNASGTGTALVTLRIHAAPEAAEQSVGDYHIGDTIYARVVFNAPVTVTGQPVLQGAVQFRYASGSGTTALTFTHTVTASDPAGAIFPYYTWPAGDGTITDANGLTATSTIPLSRLQVGQTVIYPTPAPAIAVSNPGHLINLSVLGFTGPGSQVLTVGFVIGGGQSGATQPLLVRGIGPGLAAFGLAASVPDPTLTLYRQQTALAFNDNWSGVAAVRAAANATGAFALTDGSLDAALLTSLAAGAYTMQITATAGGNALAEIYDATPHYDATAPRLVNLSCLSELGSGGTLTCGFVIGGTTSRRVLVRVVGPALAPLGVAHAMSNPSLQLYQSLPTGPVLLGQNHGWAGNLTLAATFQAVGAFPFSDPASADSALAMTLFPGNYSIQTRSTTGASGTVLVEVYEAP